MKLYVVMYQPDILLLAKMSLQGKCNEIRKAIAQALILFEEYKTEQPDSKLLFLMPENSFQKNDSITYYSKLEKEKLFEFFKKISTHCPDVILFPGSIKYLKPLNKATACSVKQGFVDNGLRYYQLLQQKYDSPVPDLSSYMAGYLQTNIEYVATNTTCLFYNGSAIEIDKKSPDKSELRVGDEQKHCLFQFGTQPNIHTIAGLTIGVEICCDHDFGLLKHKAAQKDKLIDLHIVISSTIPTLNDCIACHANGIFIHCDAIPAKNSMVIQFKDGKGKEQKAVKIIQDKGLMTWALDIRPSPSQQSKMDQICLDFGNIVIYKRNGIR